MAPYVDKEEEDEGITMQPVLKQEESLGRKLIVTLKVPARVQD